MQMEYKIKPDRVVAIISQELCKQPGYDHAKIVLHKLDFFVLLFAFQIYLFII